MEKQFISALNLYRDSFALAHQIRKDNFLPDFIIALWRGGTPVGIIVQEYLDYFGCHADHIAIRTSAYDEPGLMHPDVRIHGLDYIIDRVLPKNKLLIVDDVFDSGKTLESLINRLHNKCRHNCPHDIRLATLYFKPTKNQTQISPNYYIHTTDSWLIFPHELKGLTLDEIQNFKDDQIKTYFNP